jgi:SulP family sulfate permease
LNTQVASSVVSGVVVGLFSILFYLSYAALIFAGPLAPWLGYGLAATFITGAIGGTLMALRSSLPFGIGGPDGSTSAVTAALVATLASRMIADGQQEHLLPAALIVLMLSAALTGLLLGSLGLARAGRAIRFVPYPVIGGFLGASGVLILLGAVQVLTGTRLGLSSLADLASGDSLAKLASALAIGLFLLAGRRFSRSPLVMPAQLLACLVGFYVVLFALGVPAEQARQAGWLFTAPAVAAFDPPWTLDLSLFPWRSLPALSADLLAVMFVGALSVLLNITSVELRTRHEADLDRELKVLGAANMLSAAMGGYVASLTATRTNMNFALSRGARIPGVVVAGLSAAALFVQPDYIGYMPRCVLGGLLLTLGYDLVARWLVVGARQLARLEYVSLLAITAIIVVWGFLPGVAIGVIFGCATFALSAGRVSAIKFAFDGSEYRSSLDRGARELALLGAHGSELQGLSLQSYLFFGSANRLYEHVKALLVQNPECRFLLFDFRLVTGIDSSATQSFTKIKQAADSLGTKLVMVNLSPVLTQAFDNIGFLTPDIQVVGDLDHALEACENAIIAAHSSSEGEAGSLHDWLAEALADPVLADRLAHACRRLEFRAGDVLAEQGGPADSMHFVLEGRVGIIVALGDGRSIRVRSLGRHTTVGEMGLITGRPRSATVQAEADGVAYELPVGAFNRLKAEQPALAQALLIYVIGVMTERLSFASRLIGVLQR